MFQEPKNFIKSKNIIKIGKRRGIQRYLCKTCNKKFQHKRRPVRLQEKIFNEYIFHRQTLIQLSEKYKRSIPWIRQQINEFDVGEKVHNSRVINLACDATFYGKKKDNLGYTIKSVVLDGKRGIDKPFNNICHFH